jgi:hypothetical protein
MKQKIKNYSIYLLLLIGVLVAGNLSLNEIMQEGACPKLGFIPACYIVFFCFLIPLIAHFLKRYNTIFYIFTGFAFALATYASIGQFMDKLQCPKTDFGLPKCYISFALLLGIIVLKYSFNNRQNQIN